MANFDQKVTINIDVDSEGVASNVGEVATELRGLKAVAEGLDDDLDSVAGSMDNFAESTKKVRDADFGGAVESSEEDVNALTKAQRRLNKQANRTQRSLEGENNSMRTLMEGADSLAEFKHAASNANERLGSVSDETKRKLAEERQAAGASGEWDKYIRRLKSASDSTEDAARATRRLKSQMDDSSSSMRAAAAAGHLFDDGLGSLSLNLGAFTIALRNFLTQVPLIITGLGALGAAALGAAAAVGTLVAALVTLIAVGFIAHLQDIRDGFANVEDLSQALMVAMRNLLDTFKEAAAPMLELKNVTDFFTMAVEGLTFAVRLLSNVMVDLVNGTGELESIANSAGQEFLTMGDVMEKIDGDSLEEIASALMMSWALLGEEVMWALGVFADGLSDAIRRSSLLLAEVEDVSGAIDKFSDMISDLAETGFAIGGGLLPIFKAFAVVVDTVAQAINELDSEMIQNLITLGAIIVTVDKLSGALGTVVNVGPSVATGLARIAVEAASAGSAMTGLQVATSGVAGNFGQFLAQTNALGGIATLVTSLTTTRQSMREMAFNTARARYQFRQLARSMLESDVALEAIEGSLDEASTSAVFLSSNTDDLSDELRELAIQGELTEEALDDTFDGVNANLRSVPDKSDFLPDISKSNMFGELGDSVEDVNEKFIEFRTWDTTQLRHGIKGNGDAAKEALDGLSDSFSKVAKTSGAARVPTSLYGAATQALSASAILGEIAQLNFAGALKLASAQIQTAIVQTTLYIAKQIGLTNATLSATAATVTLDAATTSLTMGLDKVVLAIVSLIVALGALTVGILKNMDSIKSSAGGTFASLARIIGGLSEIVMTVFVATWDALVMALSPVIDIITALTSSFALARDSTQESGNAIGAIVAMLETLANIASFTIRVIGALSKIIISLGTYGIQILTSAIGTLLGLLVRFVDWISSGLGNALSSGGEDIKGFADLMLFIFETINEGWREMTLSVQGFINKIISGMNFLFEEVSKIPGVKIESLEKVDITRDEAGAGLGEEGPEAEGKSITYNEDNSTNIDQTVDADPEDQAQLSRVVTDAMEQANSFERRRQGGQ